MLDYLAMESRYPTEKNSDNHEPLANKVSDNHIDSSDMRAALQLQQLIGEQPTGPVRQLVKLLADNRVDKALFFVAKDGSKCFVSQAASCLIGPQEGDYVEVLSSGNKHWVVSVLERANPDSQINIDFSGPVCFRLPEFYVLASERVRMETGTLALTSKRHQVTARDRVTEIKRADIEYVNSKSTHCEKFYQIHSGYASITASSLLKLDAAQLHMG